MLDIVGINHVGVRISDKQNSITFYKSLGFEFEADVGFEAAPPIVMRHPSGIVLNLLGPASSGVGENILMDVAEKYSGITHFALTVSSLEVAKQLVVDLGIAITGSFSFSGMSAIFIRDPDRNVIELDAFDASTSEDMSGYANHP